MATSASPPRWGSRQGAHPVPEPGGRTAAGRGRPVMFLAMWYRDHLVRTPRAGACPSAYRKGAFSITCPRTCRSRHGARVGSSQGERVVMMSLQELSDRMETEHPSCTTRTASISATGMASTRCSPPTPHRLPQARRHRWPLSADQGLARHRTRALPALLSPGGQHRDPAGRDAASSRTLCINPMDTRCPRAVRR